MAQGLTNIKEELVNKEKLGRYLQFALVVLAAGAIYPVIYLKAQYQETILEVFNMTLPQMNNLYSILGMVFVFGYFPSGILSDKFSAKNLLAISLLGTAIGGFWFAQVPEFSNVGIIFAIWGFFSVFTFWSSHMKVVKMLSTADEDGRFFGILDGGRGLVEALLALVALGIFSGILGTSLDLGDKKSALVAVIYMYSAVLLVTSILVFIFVEDDKKKGAAQIDESSRFRFSDLGEVFKNKYVYIQGLVVFAGYTVFWTNYYYGGHMQTNLGVSPVTVGSIMVAVLWMRPIGGTLGGFLADKIGKSVTIAGALVGAGICLVLLAILPSTLPTAVYGALIIVSGLFLYAIRGTYWSLLGQSKINAAIMGTAIGVISFIGYLPDIVLPQMNSFLWNTFGNEGGYKAYFVVSMVIGLAGAVIAIVYKKLHTADKAKVKVEV
jgi:MFS family permease